MQLSFMRHRPMVEATLKRTAVQMSKMCNDLRWLSSGPRCGLYEMTLPPMQPGSSIMPGKVNPVVPEVVNQICFQIIGYNAVISMAAEASELALNMAEPIIEGLAATVGDIDMQAGCEGGLRR